MARILLITVLISCLIFLSCKEKKQPPPLRKVPVNLDTGCFTAMLLIMINILQPLEALSQVNLVAAGAGLCNGNLFYRRNLV